MTASRGELVGGIAADDTAATLLRAVATVIERKRPTRAPGPDHVIRASGPGAGAEAESPGD